MPYSFTLADFDLKDGQAPEVGYIKCVDKQFVEIGYMDGRKVRYLYSHATSEKRIALGFSHKIGYALERRS